MLARLAILGSSPHSPLAVALAAALAVVALAVATPMAKADSVTVNPGDYVPESIDQDTFYGLVTDVASYWGIGIDGTTDALAGDRDGSNVLSFAPLDPNTLGAYIFWYSPVYKTWRTKKCHRTHFGKRRCHWVQHRRFLYDLIVENDVAINPDVPWNPGPGYPPPDKYDLETVLFHELGHYADPNAPHAARCSGSPLTEALDTGEWWRSHNDWFELGCGLGKRSARTSHGATGFVVVRHELPARYVHRGAHHQSTILGEKVAR